MVKNSATALYPMLSVEHIKNPNRFYAIPIFGLIFKIIILLPILLEFFFLGIGAIVLMIINAFVVLLTGEIWNTWYTYVVGMLSLHAKVSLFFFGLTNKYPGFSLSINDPLVKFSMPKPAHPSRAFAIPLVGAVMRLVLLIPFFIFTNAIQNAAMLGVIISSFPVLFNGRYPESTYELSRDFLRLHLATTFYFTGISDEYPSFYISMDHQTIKLFLIIFGFWFMPFSFTHATKQPSMNWNQYRYQNQRIMPTTSDTMPNYNTY